MWSSLAMESWFRVCECGEGPYFVENWPLRLSLCKMLLIRMVELNLVCN